MLLTVFACKQNGRSETGAVAAPNSVFSLSAQNQTTGSIGLVATVSSLDSERTPKQLDLIECNSLDLVAAASAVIAIGKAGALISEDGRSVTGLGVDVPIGVECHLLHSNATIDAKALTLLNEQLRGLSGLRVPSRSDLSTYELAQTVWLSLNHALRQDQIAVAPWLLNISFDDPELRSTVAATLDRLQLLSNVFDPCSVGHATSPRWLVEDPSLRQRSFACVDRAAVLRLDDRRPYVAVRNAMRAALVSLFEKSRGMRPVRSTSQDVSRFALTNMIHLIEDSP